MINPFLNRMRVRYAAMAVFLLLLSLWTWKLLEPNPVPEQMRQFLSFWDWLPFVLAKCLHMTGYAVLTMLAMIWVPTYWGQRIAVTFMVLHGMGTEIGQTYVPNRTGTVKDVLIDSTGIVIGVLIIRWLTRRNSRQFGVAQSATPAVEKYVEQ